MTHELHETFQPEDGPFESCISLEEMVDSILLGGNTPDVTYDTPSVRLLAEEDQVIDVRTLGDYGGLALTGVMSLSFAVLLATSNTPSGQPTTLAFTEGGQSFSAIAIIVAGTLWLATAGAIRSRLS